MPVASAMRVRGLACGRWAGEATHQNLQACSRARHPVNGCLSCVLCSPPSARVACILHMANATAQANQNRVRLLGEWQTSVPWWPSSRDTRRDPKRPQHLCFSRPNAHQPRSPQVVQNADALLQRFRGRLAVLAHALQSKYGVSEQRHLPPALPSTRQAPTRFPAHPEWRHDTCADARSDTDTTHSLRFLPSFSFRWCEWLTRFVRSSSRTTFSSRDTKLRASGGSHVRAL